MSRLLNASGKVLLSKRPNGDWYQPVPVLDYVPPIGFTGLIAPKAGQGVLTSPYNDPKRTYVNAWTFNNEYKGGIAFAYNNGAYYEVTVFCSEATVATFWAVKDRNDYAEFEVSVNSLTTMVGSGLTMPTVEHIHGTQYAALSVLVPIGINVLRFFKRQGTAVYVQQVTLQAAIDLPPVDFVGLVAPKAGEAAYELIFNNPKLLRTGDWGYYYGASGMTYASSRIYDGSVYLYFNLFAYVPTTVDFYFWLGHGTEGGSFDVQVDDVTVHPATHTWVPAQIFIDTKLATVNLTPGVHTIKVRQLASTIPETTPGEYFFFHGATIYPTPTSTAG